MSRIKTTKIKKKRDQKDGFVSNVGILYDQKHNYKSKKVEKYVMFCAIWYHLYNLKNIKNTNGGVLHLVRLQALLQITLLHGCFSGFLNCTNGTNLRNASRMRLFDFLLDYLML